MIEETDMVLPTINPVQSSPFSIGLRLRIGLWGLVRGTLWRLGPGRLRGWRRFLLRLFGARIASTASIHKTARIDLPWNLTMDAYASLGEHSWAYSVGKIHIGKYACISKGAQLITATHDICDPAFRPVIKPITIGYGSWIALNAIVLPGVNIGPLAVIGAGAVVGKDMPSEMVCFGNPCRAVKKRIIRQEEL